MNNTLKTINLLELAETVYDYDSKDSSTINDGSEGKQSQYFVIGYFFTLYAILLGAFFVGPV